MEINKILDFLRMDQLARVEASTKNTDRDIPLIQVSDLVSAIIGMRRTGKTSYLQQLIRERLAQGVSMDQILYLNFEDDRIKPYSQEKLARLVDTFYESNPENYQKRCYLFLDEIQVIPEWAQVIRRLHDTKDAEIVITGSSAKMLSKEIHTSMRGRSIATEMWPFSFDEYLKSHDVKSISKHPGEREYFEHFKHLEYYLTNGGFPGVMALDQTAHSLLLQEYVDLVMLRDVIERHHITGQAMAKYCAHFMLQNMSGIFSINKMFNDLKSQGHKASRASLSEYIEHIEDAYLAFTLEIYSPSMRKRATNPKKIYTIDSGLSKAFSLSFSPNYGPAFENLVYLDLRRMNCYEINYYLTEQRYEVDFLARTRLGERRLIQVVWETNDPATMERKRRALEIAEKETGIPGEIITPEKYIRKETWLHQNNPPKPFEAAYP